MPLHLELLLHPGTEKTPRSINQIRIPHFQLPMENGVLMVVIVFPALNKGVPTLTLSLTSPTCLLACEHANGSCLPKDAERRTNAICGMTKKKKQAANKGKSADTKAKAKAKPKGKGDGKDKKKTDGRSQSGGSGKSQSSQSSRNGRSGSDNAVSEGGSKIPWKDRPCTKFIAGNCTFGDKCKFKHDGVTAALAAAKSSAKAEAKAKLTSEKKSKKAKKEQSSSAESSSSES